MRSITILDYLSKLGFQALMVDVFRNHGYQNVQQPPKTGDEGRDILMMETVPLMASSVVSSLNAITGTGRPRNHQKLHSSVIIYDV